MSTRSLAVMCGAALLSSLCAGQSCPVLGVSLRTQPTEASSVGGGEATSCCGSPHCSLQNLLCSLRPQPQFPLRCCHCWDHSLLIPVWARSWSQPPCWNLLQVSTCTSDDQALSLVGMFHDPPLAQACDCLYYHLTFCPLCYVCAV